MFYETELFLSCNMILLCRHIANPMNTNQYSHRIQILSMVRRDLSLFQYTTEKNHIFDAHQNLKSSFDIIEEPKPCSTS